MGYLELDTAIGREVTAMVKEVRRFAENDLAVIGRELDQEIDPAAVSAANSSFRVAIRRYRQLELHTRDIPREMGGLAGELDPKAGPIITEEMGRGDAGLALSLAVSDLPFVLAATSPDEQTRQLAADYCRDTSAKMIGCWAVPDAGGDLGRLMTAPKKDPAASPPAGVRAVRQQDEYILRGETAGWAVNAPLATHAAVLVDLDTGGSGLALVPLDLPGISVGAPLDCFGQRALPRSRLFFEAARIPEAGLVVPDLHQADPAVLRLMTRAGAACAGAALGLAQAAYEEALHYAHQRVQGGQPIFAHKNIKLQLFTMFTRVETARAFYRRVALHNETSDSPSVSHAAAARWFCTRAAFETASDAIGVFGGNGLTKEYPVEKMFRDARTAMTWEGDGGSLCLTGWEEPVV